MAEAGGFFSIFTDIGATLSGEGNLLFTLLFFTAVIVIYAIFVFYFYRYLAKKNIIGLNLSQYTESEYSTTLKILATLFYIIEYLIILPILTFFWFAVLAILILILAEGVGASTILVISAALVASVRITSYVSEKLSQDLAKMLPFTLLAIAIIKPNFFDVSALISRFSEIPSLFSNIAYYLMFIIILELIMRFADLINKILKTKKEESAVMKA
tara:strand:+ start:117 stop:758 length:642 start_codon:yes stop_codon:yes gene_type:complete